MGVPMQHKLQATSYEHPLAFHVVHLYDVATLGYSRPWLQEDP